MYLEQTSMENERLPGPSALRLFVQGQERGGGRERGRDERFVFARDILKSPGGLSRLFLG